MKRLRYFLPLLLVALAVPSIATAHWQIVTVEGGTGEVVASHTSLAVDSGGTPHISYVNPMVGALKYAYHDGTLWQIETVDSQGSRRF